MIGGSKVSFFGWLVCNLISIAVSSRSSISRKVHGMSVVFVSSLPSSWLVAVIIGTDDIRRSSTMGWYRGEQVDMDNRSNRGHVSVSLIGMGNMDKMSDMGLVGMRGMNGMDRFTSSSKMGLNLRSVLDLITITDVVASRCSLGTYMVNHGITVALGLVRLSYGMNERYGMTDMNEGSMYTGYH